MPKDKHDQPLAVGDRVLVEATIVRVTDGEKNCNVTFQLDDVVGEHSAQVQCNSKHVSRVGEPVVMSDAPPATDAGFAGIPGNATDPVGNY